MSAWQADREGRMAQLKREATEAAGAKSRLLRLVASGTLPHDDPDISHEIREADERRRRAEEALRTAAA